DTRAPTLPAAVMRGVCLPTTLEELKIDRPGIEANTSLRDKAIQTQISLRRPISLDRVVQFENEAHISLPNDYVFFVTMVGNGGVEQCRLVRIEDWDRGYWSNSCLATDLV